MTPGLDEPDPLPRQRLRHLHPTPPSEPRQKPQQEDVDVAVEEEVEERHRKPHLEVDRGREAADEVDRQRRLGKMGKKEPRLSEQELADLEREIRSGRKFSLAGAVGRLGGGDLLKGASPVTRKRQAELEVKLFLEKHLADAEGALKVVLKRRVRDSETLLAAGYEQPLSALARITEHILSSEERLRSFVHRVDAEWGRIYLERPHFQKAGRPPDRDDPYTFASVRVQLSKLLDELRGFL